MGGSISSNTNPKVPITFLYTAHMMGGYSFCHAYVYCHGKKPEEVWGFIEAAYLEKTKEEIRKIAERWGSCLLDVNDDDLGCAMMEDGEFVWNIAPENQDDCEEDFEGFYPDKIRSYHVDYVIDGDTILITYMPPVYWANFGERLVDVSRAMYGAIKKANERFNVSYYIYEGYAHMGLTDELYIKMNSRGKPLTMFEHFKAELEREIRNYDEHAADRVISKIDCTWTDLLWRYRNGDSETAEDNIIDDEFLHYFRFVCDVICYKEGESPQGNSNDEFSLLQKYFTVKNEHVTNNIETLEKFFDCWCNIPGYTAPEDFLLSFMSHTHEKGKILVEARNMLDIFGDCLHTYTDKSGRTRQFHLNRFVLLYAITQYLQNLDKINENEFRHRIRIINNLIQNSEDEVSDRADRNRMPAILGEVDAIILTGQIDDSIENNFNVNQLAEEKEKLVFLEANPDMRETLYTLEDNSMLHGQISVIGLENLKYADRFASLFKCQWDKIDCALMATGDYGQLARNKWRYQYASSKMLLAWDSLFHKGANYGFDKTKDVLVKLLGTSEVFTDAVLKGISDTFMTECEAKQEFPWRYYYVKYSVFRPGSYGKLTNENAKEKPYMFSVMQTRTQWSSNTYMPFLKAADRSHLSREDFGQRLVYGNEHIICDNSAYIVRNNEDNSVVDTIKIAQNENGIDIEDRIVKLTDYLVERYSIDTVWISPSF